MAREGILYNDQGRTKYHGGKMTSYLFLACLIASSGGLIFGYDIGISGGVTSMDSFLKQFFPTLYHKAGHNSNKATNQYCKFNNELLTLFTSSFYLAAFFASFLASTITRSFGRRLSMFFGGAVFLTGAILNGAAENVAMLIIGRLLLGVGVGFTNQSVPLYLSEMAPSSMRGMLNNIFPLMINIGILFANFVNYLSVDVEGGWGWRISLGSAAIPALIITVGSIFLPETPNSLIEQGEPESAHEMLKKIRGIDDVLDEYDELVAASEESRKVEHPWMNILKRKNRPQLVMSILIPFFQQLTGISIIMFYAPVLFKTIGLESDASLYSAVVTGGVTVLSTFLTIVAIDKVGRRFLFLEGGVQMFICQIVFGVLIGNKFGLTGKGSISKGYAEVILAFICVYVAAFAWSWGPLGLLVPSEIFPLEIRSAGQSINVSVNMLFTFIIAEVFLNMLCHMKYFLFFFFAGWVLVMTLFILFFFPETKSVPLEEMALVWGHHRFWGRFISDQDIPQGIQIVARRRQTSI